MAHKNYNFVRISVFLFLFFSQLSIISAQTYDADQLVAIWRTSDKTQTLEATKANKDLRRNYNNAKFLAISKEIREKLKNKPDPRINARLVLYETAAQLFKDSTIDNSTKVNLQKSIKYALQLKDEQLLSEIYAKYYEQGFGDPSEKLYYVTKAVEIQEKIGQKYIPDLYLRYYNLSLSYNLSQEFSASIDTGLRGLQLLEKPENHLDIYCFLLDLVGNGYNEIGKTEKGAEYYQKLLQTLEFYTKNYSKFNQRFIKYDSRFVEIWSGIAKGGIAFNLIKKNKLVEAKNLLEQNFQISNKHQLFNDIANIKNLQASIANKTGDYNLAIIDYSKAYENGEKSLDNRQMLTSLYGLSNSYKSINQYDKAYYFSEKYHQLKDEFTKKISNQKSSAIAVKLSQENLKNEIEKAEITIKKKDSERNINLLIFGIILLIVSFVYRGYYYRQKIKIQRSDNQRKNAEKELDQFRQKLSQNNKIIEALENENKINAEEFSALKETTILTNDDWENFKKQFEKAYPKFLIDISKKFPQLSQAELRYLCLSKLELSANEISSALGISTSSLRVTKYRIRKKIGEENDDFLQNLVKINE